MHVGNDPPTFVLNWMLGRYDSAKSYQTALLLVTKSGILELVGIIWVNESPHSQLILKPSGYVSLSDGNALETPHVDCSVCTGKCSPHIPANPGRLRPAARRYQSFC